MVYLNPLANVIYIYTREKENEREKERAEEKEHPEREKRAEKSEGEKERSRRVRWGKPFMHGSVSRSNNSTRILVVQVLLSGLL